MRRILTTTPLLLALAACAPAPDAAEEDAAPPPSGTAAPDQVGTPADTPPAASPSAVPDQAGDPWAAARARGVDFRAVGQEPGWFLELEDETEIRFARMGGDTLVFSDVPRPSRAIESPSLHYAVRSEGRTLNLVIVQEACEDTMSGERFPAQVTVELDGQTYEGCGRPLQEG